MSIGLTFLVKDPELSRFRVLIEYLREISREFVIVVDDRTTVKSQEVMSQWPDTRIVPITWQNDFAWARNQGLPLIRSDWTAYFDPDELPNSRLLKFMRDADAEKKSPAGYLFDTHNHWNGHNMHAHQELDWHLRMWKTGRGRFYRPVHELVEIDGKKENMTRGTPLVVKAPREAFIIHAKPASVTAEDSQLYTDIEKGKV